MKLLFVNLIFCIISTILVFTAPDNYSFSFCLTILIIFVVQNFIYFAFNKEKNLVSFELFFMISFFFTNFVYPVFYFPKELYPHPFNIPFEENIISKSTAIAYFAYSVFLLFVTQTSKQKEKKKKEPFKFPSSSLNIIFILTIITFFLYVITGGLEAMRDVYSGDGNINDVGLYSYFNDFFVIFCYLLGMFLFRNISKHNIIIYGIALLVLSVVLLTTGTRGFILGLGLILFVGFNNNIKKISFGAILTCVILGTFLLVLVVTARNVSIADDRWIENILANFRMNSFLDLFLDLIINNRNLYILVEYTDQNQFDFFSGMISDITAPFPGLFSYIISKTNFPVELITSGNLPTYLDIGPGSAYGLGTNMVGEAYRFAGLWGILLFFSLIGIVIRKSRNAMDYNIYAYVIYYLFVSHAVFYPRAPILFNPRIIVWTLLVVFLIKNLYINKSSVPNLLSYKNRIN